MFKMLTTRKSVEMTEEVSYMGADVSSSKKRYSLSPVQTLALYEILGITSGWNGISNNDLGIIPDLLFPSEIFGSVPSPESLAYSKTYFPVWYPSRAQLLFQIYAINKIRKYNSLVNVGWGTLPTFFFDREMALKRFKSFDASPYFFTGARLGSDGISLIPKNSVGGNMKATAAGNKCVKPKYYDSLLKQRAALDPAARFTWAPSNKFDKGMCYCKQPDDTTKKSQIIGFCEEKKEGFSVQNPPPVNNYMYTAVAIIAIAVILYLLQTCYSGKYHIEYFNTKTNTAISIIIIILLLTYLNYRQ